MVCRSLNVFDSGFIWYDQDRNKRNKRIVRKLFPLALFLRHGSMISIAIPMDSIENWLQIFICRPPLDLVLFTSTRSNVQPIEMTADEQFQDKLDHIVLPIHSHLKVLLH